jgi:hypothetical protein
LHNVTSNNAGSQWIWFSIIDKVLSDTAKADKVSGGMDNGKNVGVEDQLPSRLEEGT